MIFSKRFGIFLISFFVMTSFLGQFVSDDASGQQSYSLSLYDAYVTEGWVWPVIQGAYSGSQEYANLENGDGIFFGQCIEFEVENLVDQTLYITLNSGRILECEESGTQNMVVTRGYYFILSPYETESFTVYAMCMNMYEDAPIEGIYYELGQLCTGSTYDVVKQIGDNNYNDASGQCALWAVTDSAYGSYLREYGATDDDITTAQDILDNAGVAYNIEQGEAGLPIILIIIVIVIIVVVIAILIVAIILVKRKKHMTPPTPPLQHVIQQTQVQPETKTAPTKTTTKFCTNCGQKLDVDSKFCSECGQKL